jgi:hypothetical protein
MTTPEDNQDFLTLKWGTLKAWRLSSDRGKELLAQYYAIGSCESAMLQRDTPEQKELVCQMIDECSAETVHLDWDGIDVSKAEAKRYVMEYGLPRVEAKP